jgi:hypothetical protein
VENFKENKMKQIISLSIIISVLLMFTVNINGLMIANESNKAYCGGDSGDPCPPDTLKASTKSSYFPTIRELIIAGGGYMLKSSMYINGFLNKIELSGPSPNRTYYKGLQGTLNSAIYYMEKARFAYFQLNNLAGETPYNQNVINRLIGFDYNSFQQEYKLFPSIFFKVKELLSLGDVTGVYSELYSYCNQILDLLYIIKRDVDTGIFPELSIVWDVNQYYSEFKLFGQYVARIFYCIN